MPVVAKGKRKQLGSSKASHALLDSVLLISLVSAVYLLTDGPKAAWTAIGDQFRFKDFPNHYTPVFNFVHHPMPPVLAVSIWIIGIYFLIKTYYLERGVVMNAHKKYTAHRNNLTVLIHGVGSVVEMAVGCAACCNPQNEMLARATAYLTLFVTVPSGAILTPRVFGIKYLTVAGFAKFGLLRALEAYRVLFVNFKLVPNLWILLQVGTVVRLLGWFVLPYSSTDGVRGDLFTEPTIYSFNILLSGYLTAAFVYPPKYLLGSLLLYAITNVFYPPRISTRWVKKHL